MAAPHGSCLWPVGFSGREIHDPPGECSYGHRMSDERGFQTRVYKYRCLGDLPEAALTELRRVHDLSNLLIEFEKAHAERVAEAWRQYPELEALEKEVQDADAEVERIIEKQKRYKQANRTAKANPEYKADLANARKVRRECKDRFNEAKRLTYPIIKERLNELSDELRAQVKQTYKVATGNGLYWANFNAVRERHMSAVKAVRELRKAGRPADLRFRRWTGEGTLTVQLQRAQNQPPRLPVTIADAEKGPWRNVALLSPAHDPDGWGKLTRAQQRRIRVGTLRFRIGSQVDKQLIQDEVERRLAALDECTDEQIETISAEVHAELDQSGHVEMPVIVHRPMPLDADIAMMEITRRQLGSRYLVHVSVVVRIPVSPARTEGDAVALHVGWRALEDHSIRVGVLTGAVNPPEDIVGVVRPHDGWSELVIPAHWREQMDYVRGVASVRAKNLDVLRKWLVDWIHRHPDHVIAGVETIDQWRSPNRFAALSLRIRTDEMIDVELRRQLEAWRVQDLHLWDLEANLRDKILARRNDAFSKVAAWALNDAAVLRVDTFKLTSLGRRPEIDEEESDAHRRARANRVLAAPGTLRGVMLDAAKRRGVTVQSVEGSIAKTHYLCGQPLELAERDTSVMVRCGYCDTFVDQDYNTLETLRRHG